jgi:hypothetical protein
VFEILSGLRGHAIFHDQQPILQMFILGEVVKLMLETMGAYGCCDGVDLYQTDRPHLLPPVLRQSHSAICFSVK